MKKVLVTGAGGFIGHHLTKFLVERGYWVRAWTSSYRSTRRRLRTSSSSSICDAGTIA